MSNIVNSTSLVPIIPKAKFDNVAYEFLGEYCPEALEMPMPVPILDIAKNKMGLHVYTKYRLSEDFSILGQMCFTGGIVDLYLKETDEFRAYKVRGGTMFIDPDVIEKRNEGCFNNTVAHECVHWYKHHDYHILQAVADQKNANTRFCPVDELDEGKQPSWTDEDWMEWQANGIAPRILMPKGPFLKSVVEFTREWNSCHTTAVPAGWLEKKLAEFYKVSKQSAGIRMDELGVSV